MQRRSIRTALLVATLALGAGALSAQATPNRESGAEFRKQFMNDLDTLASKVLALANAVPAEKYSWRPTTGVRSFGEVFMHIASEYYVYTPMSFGGARSPVIPRAQDAMPKFEATSDKATVLKHLQDGFAYGRAQIMALPADSLAGIRKLFGRDFTVMETGLGMTADLHEHLGQLIAYARMNGITPPWSK